MNGILKRAALIGVALFFSHSLRAEEGDRLLAARIMLLEGDAKSAGVSARALLEQAVEELRTAKDPSDSRIRRAVEIQNLTEELGVRYQIVDRGDDPAGHVAYLAARLAPAREGFENVLKLHPGNRACRRALATMDADAGKWDAARDQFFKLIQESPADPDTRHRFAFALLDRGAADEALEQWAEAVAHDPGHADSWYGLGTFWLGRRLWESSTACFQRALAANPTHWGARKALIQSMVGQGRFTEVGEHRQLLRKLSPELKRLGDSYVAAVLPRPQGALLAREALTDAPGWLFRFEHFDQAKGDGKPIRIMELRREGTGYALGEVGEAGAFSVRTRYESVPELERLLEDAR